MRLVLLHSCTKSAADSSDGIGVTFMFPNLGSIPSNLLTATIFTIYGNDSVPTTSADATEDIQCFITTGAPTAPFYNRSCAERINIEADTVFTISNITSTGSITDLIALYNNVWVMFGLSIFIIKGVGPPGHEGVATIFTGVTHNVVFDDLLGDFSYLDVYTSNQVFLASCYDMSISVGFYLNYNAIYIYIGNTYTKVWDISTNRLPNLVKYAGSYKATYFIYARRVGVNYVVVFGYELEGGLTIWERFTIDDTLTFIPGTQRDDSIPTKLHWQDEDGNFFYYQNRYEQSTTLYEIKRFNSDLTAFASDRCGTNFPLTWSTKTLITKSYKSVLLDCNSNLIALGAVPSGTTMCGFLSSTDLNMPISNNVTVISFPMFGSDMNLEVVIKDSNDITILDYLMVFDCFTEVTLISILIDVDTETYADVNVTPYTISCLNKSFYVPDTNTIVNFDGEDYTITINYSKIILFPYFIPFEISDLSFGKVDFPYPDFDFIVGITEATVFDTTNLYSLNRLNFNASISITPSTVASGTLTKSYFDMYYPSAEIAEFFDSLFLLWDNSGSIHETQYNNLDLIDYEIQQKLIVKTISGYEVQTKILQKTFLDCNSDASLSTTGTVWVNDLSLDFTINKAKRCSLNTLLGSDMLQTYTNFGDNATIPSITSDSTSCSEVNHLSNNSFLYKDTYKDLGKTLLISEYDYKFFGSYLIPGVQNRGYKQTLFTNLLPEIPGITVYRHTFKGLIYSAQYEVITKQQMDFLLTTLFNLLINTEVTSNITNYQIKIFYSGTKMLLSMDAKSPDEIIVDTYVSEICDMIYGLSSFDDVPVTINVIIIVKESVLL